MAWLSRQLDRFINWACPINLNGMGDDLWADELADWEETTDVFEPDELWSAHHNLTAPGTPPSPDVAVTPAEGDRPASATFGGLFNFLRNRG